MLNKDLLMYEGASAEGANWKYVSLTVITEVMGDIYLCVCVCVCECVCVCVSE